MRADARKNYDLLIDVAREVFVEQGAEASLRDIARRAGVGMGTLYRHFPNRDSLLEALLRSRFAALTARLSRFCAPPILPRRCWSGWPRAWRLPISIAGSSPR